MKLFLQMKTVGKRKPILDSVPYELPDSIHTLRELLTELVKIDVTRYNAREAETQLLPFLTHQEIEDQAQIGKVSFGRIYSDRKANEQKAIQNAIQCFEDGPVRVFCNDTECEVPDAPLTLRGQWRGLFIL